MNESRGGPVMPTTKQLVDYSSELPEIYRDVLWAFPKLAPDRKAGDPLAVSSIVSYLAGNLAAYDSDQVLEACRRLAANDFAELKNGMFVHPTPLGERLIAVVTGQHAPARQAVPELPKPTW